MKNLEHIFKQLGEESLSASERAHMRTVISEYARFKPLGHSLTGEAIRLPQEEARVSPYVFLSRFARQPAAAGVLSLFLLFTTTAYAAASAKPGDLLYPLQEAFVEAFGIETSAPASPEADTFLEQSSLEAANDASAGGTMETRISAPAPSLKAATHAELRTMELETGLAASTTLDMGSSSAALTATSTVEVLPATLPSFPNIPDAPTLPL